MKARMAVAALVLALACAVSLLVSANRRLKEERDIYRQNTEGLMKGVETLRKDSAMQAYQIQTLSLDLDEFRKYKEEADRTIRELKLKEGRVTAVGRQEMAVDADIRIPVTKGGGTFYRAELSDPGFRFSALVKNDTLEAELHIPVNVTQILYRVPKHRFLWWRWGCKGVRQIIVTDNPYVRLNCAEYIEIRK